MVRLSHSCQARIDPRTRRESMGTGRAAFGGGGWGSRPSGGPVVARPPRRESMGTGRAGPDRAGGARVSDTRFEVLGPLRVVRAGRPVPIGADQERILLAVLLMKA